MMTEADCMSLGLCSNQASQHRLQIKVASVNDRRGGLCGSREGLKSQYRKDALETRRQRLPIISDGNL